MSDPSVASQLESAGTKPLRFLLDGKQLVPNDFHVTEIKKLTVEALDCGGGSASWQELVIQLWSPSGDYTLPAMHARTLLEILTKAEVLALLDKVPLRFEYGAAGMPAVQYPLAEIRDAGDTLAVDLMLPGVTCKARDRAARNVSAAACCA